MISRRRFLSATALASAGATIGTAAGGKVARAFIIEEPAARLAGEYHAARAAACAAAPVEHAAIIADLRALLARDRVPEEELGIRLARATCPFCGCALIEG